MIFSGILRTPKGSRRAQAPLACALAALAAPWGAFSTLRKARLPILGGLFLCCFLRWGDATEAGVSPLPPAFLRAAEKSAAFTSRDLVLCMEYLAANFPGLVPLWAMLTGLLVEVAEVAISVVPVLEAVEVVMVVVAVAPPFPIVA
ncbi:hypothetical protein Taro_005053 [Colocasia esculenta]|uniref:Uncharacterized protein n=1 Tax=Colocasia esculenta TaxID=4460 RepID=A0A843TTC1_COLES|nr:hypothetical protein [Colocasia esculenta]